MEELVRRELRSETEGVTAGPDVLGGVQRTVRRHRMRDGVLTTAAVGVLAAGVAAWGVTAHSGGSTTSAAGIAPTAHATAPVRDVVVNYHSFAGTNEQIDQGSPGEAASVVLDPATGKYVRTKLGFDVTASPNGKRYSSYDGGRVGTAADVVAGKDSAFAQLKAGQTASVAAKWSSDSNHLLISQGDAGGYLTGFRIYDATTGKLGSTMPIHHDRDVDADVAWAPQDAGVVAYSSHRLYYYGLDGKQQRTVALPAGAKPSETGLELSPDGRFLALDNGALLDLTTKQIVRPQLPSREHGAASQAGWLDAGHYAVDWNTVKGLAKDRRIFVFDRSGRLVRSITPPLGSKALPNTHGVHERIYFELGNSADFPNGAGLRLDG